MARHDDPIRRRLSDPRPGPALRLADFKDALKSFPRDQMTDRAAALPYYTMLSLFPALIFGIAALGAFGQQALINDAADYLRQAGRPGAAPGAGATAREAAPA